MLLELKQKYKPHNIHSVPAIYIYNFLVHANELILSIKTSGSCFEKKFSLQILKYRVKYFYLDLKNVILIKFL